MVAAGGDGVSWFSIRVRDWSRFIAPLPLMVVTGLSGLIVVMLPVYLVWIASGGPWLVWNDADIGFALAATGYIGLAPTMLGNLFYLYGVAVLGPARAAAFLYLSPLFSAAFSMPGWASGWPGITSLEIAGYICGTDNAGQVRSQAGTNAVGAGVIDTG